MLRSEWFNTDAVIELAWTQTWQVAAVAVLVAVVTAIFCRRRPHLAYLLWMLVLVKAVTPPLWSSPTSAFSWALAERLPAVAADLAQPLALPTPGPPPAAATSVAQNTLPAENALPKAPAPLAAEVPAATPRGAELVPPPPGRSLTLVLLLSWAFGTLAIAAWLIVSWCLLAARIRRSATMPDAELAQQFQALQQRIGLRRPVRLRVTSESLGPAALGWWRGTVLVPNSVIERSNPAEFDAIFAHELVHLRRFDPLIGTLQLAVQCLWWWHPAIWWANRQVRVERERSCDEAVLAQLDVRPADYARLLVELLRQGRSPVPAVFWSGMRSSSATTARVRHVLEAKTFRRRSPLAAWLMAGIAVLVVLPGAGSRFITAAPPAEGVEHASVPDGEQQPASTEIPVAPASESANRQQSPAEAAAFQELSSRGAVWGTSGNAEKRWAVTLPNSFDPGNSPLPLAALSRVLVHVSVVGQPMSAGRLRAQLLSLKELPADVSLTVGYTAENASALDAVLSIPNLTSLGLLSTGNSPPIDWTNAETRPFAISDLKRLTNLTLSAVDGDLPEIARLTNLEQLGLHGSFSSAAVNELKSLTRLKSLNVYGLGGPSTRPQDLACLDQFSNLERLNIGGLLNDAAAKRIGSLTKLHDLTISIDGLTDAGLSAIAKATSLRVIHLSVGPSSGVSARGFSALAALKNLDRLSILGWAQPGKQPIELTDESVAGWDQLVNLRFLVISHCSIGDAGIRTLSSLPVLYCLQLEGPLQVTDAGVAALKNAPELGALVLTGSKITGAGLASLKGCKSLALVNLSGSALTDAGLESLAEVKLLSEVDVSGTQITDKGVTALADRAPNLTRLNLAQTEITDAGLSAFNKRDSLKQLNLADTKVTIAGIGQLLDANRQLMVWSVDPMTPQTRAFKPGTFQGTFQPIDGSQVLGELITANTEKVGKSAPASGDVNYSLVAPADEASSEQDESALVINHLKQLGLKVTTFPQADGPVHYVEFTSKFVNPGDPLPLDKLPGLQAVVINNRANLTDAQLSERLKAAHDLPAQTALFVHAKPPQAAALAELAGIPKLERLSLFSGEDTVPELPDLTRLKQLYLSGKIDAHAMQELQSLANLEELSLSHRGLSEATDLPFLTSLPQLKKLGVSGIDLRDATFEHVAQLKHLESLNVYLHIATDRGLEQLAKATSLKRLELRIDQTKFTITPAGLAQLSRLEQLEALTLMHLPSYAYRDGPINDAAVIPLLAGLRRLKDLQLYNGNFSNQMLVAAGQLGSLEVFEVAGPLQANEPGLRAVSNLSNLRQLTLSSENWDGKGTEHLAKLQKLEELELAHAKSLNDDALAPLATLTGLKKLNLAGASIRGSGLAPFTALKLLSDLSLERNPIDDEGAQVVARLASVSKLNLNDTQITDAGLQAIADGLPELADLMINGTKVTDAGLDRLMRLQHLKQVAAARTETTETGRKDRPWRINQNEPNFTLRINPLPLSK